MAVHRTATLNRNAAQALEEARGVLLDVIAHPAFAQRVDAAAAMIADRLGAGGKVLACGNGGSSCEAMHLCEELTGRFRDNRPALAAIACVDPGHLTCVANDFGFDYVFSRWVEALGKPGDVLVLLSTSGNSPNMVAAAAAAKAKGIATLALLGKDGGKLAGDCDFEWIVPSSRSERIQEIHLIIVHTLVDLVEQKLFPKS
ncbi:MAG: SIS domain-containing protein [Planctomycetes bacterium]|nr:SIS domain-containing protein [Planctomycetota bacterium]